MIRIVNACLTAATVLLVTIQVLLASSSFADDNFRPDTIRMVIPSSPGGGTDSMARLTGRFLSKYLPGSPPVVFINDPGASGIKALNVFTRKTKPDGLTIFAGSSSNIDPTNLRNPAVLYKPKEIRMIGGFPAPSGVLLVRKDALERFNNKSLPPATVGDVSGVRTSGQMSVWGPAYLGWNVRWVVGYKGSREVMLALERGEIDIHATFEREMIKRLLATAKFFIPAQTGVVDTTGKLVAGGHYPDIPVFSDLIYPKLRSPHEISAFKAWEVLVQGGKWFALPPGTPDAIITIYRAAFEKVYADPEFRSSGTKYLGEDFRMATGAEMEAIADKTGLISDSDINYFDELRERAGMRIEKRK